MKRIIPIGVWVQINPPGNRRSWSRMLPFSRAPSWEPFFDPQPLSCSHEEHPLLDQSSSMSAADGWAQVLAWCFDEVLGLRVVQITRSSGAPLCWLANLNQNGSYAGPFLRGFLTSRGFNVGESVALVVPSHPIRFSGLSGRFHL